MKLVEFAFGNKLNEFAPGSGDDRENDPEDVLFRFAKMWYSAPDVATQHQVEQALAKAGWEIGELESEEGGAFVMRIGDEDGDSYIGWSEEQLTDQLTEGKHRDVKFRDPELIKTQQFVKTHYPTYGADPEVAFDKWTQRALKHSEQEDIKHNEILQQLTDKIAELEKEIGDIKGSEEQLDELSFMGSQCTKDCSGHRAGYEWSKRKGRVHAASWSPSFNNGAAIAVSGR